MKPGSEGVEEVTRFAGSGDIYEGGYILYKGPDGYFIEGTDGPDKGDGDDPVPWETFSVYREDLPDDVRAEYDWADWEMIFSENELDPKKCTSDDPIDRAEALEAVVSRHGWYELDQYPLKLSYKELVKRWDDEETDDDASEQAWEATRASPYGVSEPMGLLYDLIVLAEDNKWDLDAMFAKARRLRQKAVNAEHRGDWQEGVMARELAKLMNQEKGGLSAYGWREYVITIRGKDHGWVEIRPVTKETPERFEGTWVVGDVKGEERG